MRPSTACMYLRQLLCLDALSVREIFYEVFDAAEAQNFRFAWRVRERARSVGLFTAAHQLIGFSLVWLNKLAYLAVAPEYKGKSYGSLILSHLKELSVRKSINLSLTPVEAPALIAWYTRHGFHEEYVEPAGNKNEVYRVLNFHKYNTRSRQKALSGSA